MTKTLIMMRGLPGSGKSTLAKELAGEKGVVLSTDDLFTDKDGNYNWDPALVGLNHQRNQMIADSVMEHDQPLVIIDNTNIRQGDMDPYLRMAEKYGYKVKCVEPETDWAWDPEKCAEKTTHGVPLEVIQRMKNNYQLG